MTFAAWHYEPTCHLEKLRKATNVPNMTFKKQMLLFFYFKVPWPTPLPHNKKEGKKQHTYIHIHTHRYFFLLLFDGMLSHKSFTLLSTAWKTCCTYRSPLARPIREALSTDTSLVITSLLQLQKSLQGFSYIFKLFWLYHPNVHGEGGLAFTKLRVALISGWPPTSINPGSSYWSLKSQMWATTSRFQR